MSRTIANDASWRFRLPGDLLGRFTEAYDNASERLRYLMERDLKERDRKRGGSKIRPGDAS